MPSGVKGPKNYTFTLTTVALTGYVDQVDLQMAVAELEMTNLGSDGQEYIPGLPNFQADIKITKWAKAVDDVFGPLVLNPQLVNAVITVTDSANHTATYTWTSNAFVTGYNISGQASGKVDSGPKVRLSGIPVRTTT